LDEIMLEPNSQFVITGNTNEGKIFVVTMKQEFPSLKPIMKDVDLNRKHHHHHHRHNRAGSITAAVSPVPALPDSPSVVIGDNQRSTPVIVKAPPSPAVFATPKRGSVSIQAPGSGLRSSSRMSLPSFYNSRRGSIRADNRPKHRTHAQLKSDGGMTVWSVGKSVLVVKSAACRDKSKVFKLKKQPDWVTAKPVPVEEEATTVTPDTTPATTPDVKKKIPTVPDDSSSSDSPPLSSSTS